MPSANVIHGNSSFSTFLNHATFAPQTRPWLTHCPSSINCLGPKLRAISSFQVLIKNWQNLSDTHLAQKIDQNVLPCRGFFFQPTCCGKTLWQKYCLYNSSIQRKCLHKQYPYHKGMRMFGEQPLARPKNVWQLSSANVIHQNSSFSKLLKHATFAPWTWLWPTDFSSWINFLVSKARAISAFDVLKRNYQKKIEIHVAKQKILIKTFYHLADFHFEQNFLKTHLT